MHGAFFVYEYIPLYIKTKSDGFIGAAKTFISTYPEIGLGIGTLFTTKDLGPSKIKAFISFYLFIITNN